MISSLNSVTVSVHDFATEWSMSDAMHCVDKVASIKVIIHCETNTSDAGGRVLCPYIMKFVSMSAYNVKH